MEVMERQAFIMKIEELSRRNDSLESENKELRELLKLAVDDIQKLFEAADKEYSKHDNITVPEYCEMCKYYSEKGCTTNYDAICLTWRHDDKVKKIGIAKENDDE